MMIGVSGQAEYVVCQNLAGEKPVDERKVHLIKIWRVLGVALLLRSVLPIAGYYHTRDIRIFYNPDTLSYVVPDHELIVNHRFFANGAPECIRTPGYPSLLTIGLLLDRFVVTTIVVQILLSCFTVYMVYRTALLVFESERAALIAAVLYTIEPLSIFYASQLLSETAFTALVAVWMYYLLRYIKQQSPRHLIACAIALAASIYVRPVAYDAPVIIAIALSVWALWHKQPTRTRILLHALCFLLSSVALTVPWRVRNLVEADYSGFSGISSVYMYFYLATSVLAAQQHVAFFEVQQQLGYLNEEVYLEHYPWQRGWTEGQRLNYLDIESESVFKKDIPDDWLSYRTWILTSAESA